jgi:hypothetical protein
MARLKTPPRFTEELAAFLASRPTREQLLDYRPSEAVQRRARELLQKQNDGDLSYEERQELDEFAYAERLIRLVKARLHAGKA